MGLQRPRISLRSIEATSLIGNKDSQEKIRNVPSEAQIQEIGADARKKKPRRINSYLPSDTTRLTLFSGCRQGGFKLAHQGRQPVAYRLVERAAVPARGFADRARAASDPASPVLRPGREELARRRLRQLQKLLQVLTSAARS